MKKPKNIFKWLLCTALPKVSVFILAFPLVVLIRLIRPVLWVRFIPVSERLGHGISSIDFYLLERKAGKQPSKAVDIFFPDRPWKCNRQLIKMWQRVIPVYDLAYWFVWANWDNPILKGHIYDFPPPGDRDVDGLSNDTLPPVSFSAKEEDQGAKLLQDMGIPPGSPIVCFHARDNAYLNELKPENDWTWHNYRDVDIDSYVPAVKELVARGYYVIRMGKVVNKAFAWKDPRVIDYAMSSWRSDFADMYLVSRCHFFIGNACGMDAVAVLFRKSRVVLDMVPMRTVDAWSPDHLYIFKKLWSIKDKRFLTFKEIIDSDVLGEYEVAEYKKYGLEIVDNTPEENLDVVIEKEERMKGCWQTNEEYEGLQRKFWGLYRSNKLDKWVKVFKARVGSKFLLQNKELLGA